jgi:hypothetical protein
MTMNKETNYEVAEQVLCDGCVAVPLSHLALETPVPIAGWEPLFEEHKVKVVTDYIGRPAIAAAAARRLLTTLRRQAELRAEESQRRTEKLAARHPVMAGGLPAIEGASALESLAASPGYELPSDEFQGIPKPRFLEEQLAEGERLMAEKKRAAAAKKRLIDQMMEKLR